MINNTSNDILDNQEHQNIRSLSLSVLELLIVSFTIGSIAMVLAPLTYTILVTNDTAPTDGDKIGLFLFVILLALKLLPFAFVLLFFKASNNRYMDKAVVFKPSYFSRLQQYTSYVGMFYLGFGALMSLLYGFSDYRTLYTLSMFLTGIVILIYTQKTSEYIGN